MVQRSKDCHNEVITSSLQGAIEINTCEKEPTVTLFIGFMIPDLCNKLPSSVCNQY